MTVFCSGYRKAEANVSAQLVWRLQGKIIPRLIRLVGKVQLFTVRGLKSLSLEGRQKGAAQLLEAAHIPGYGAPSILKSALVHCSLLVL